MMSATDIDGIYNELRAIRGELSRIAMHGCAKASEHSDHEQRIRATETYLARMAGAKAAIVVGGGVVGSVLTAVGGWIISVIAKGGHPQ